MVSRVRFSTLCLACAVARLIGSSAVASGAALLSGSALASGSSFGARFLVAAAQPLDEGERAKGGEDAAPGRSRLEQRPDRRNAIGVMDGAAALGA